MVLDATKGYFYDSKPPAQIRLALDSRRSARCRVRVPKDLYGRDFANHLIRKWEFRELRQTGSHIILRTDVPTGYTVSVPAHKPLRPGTLRDLIGAIADHKQVDGMSILRGL